MSIGLERITGSWDWIKQQREEKKEAKNLKLKRRRKRVKPRVKRRKATIK